MGAGIGDAGGKLNDLRAGVLACFLILVAQPGVWMRGAQRYAGDDFWTLEGVRGFGLALIAASLCLGLLWLGARASRWIRDWRLGEAPRSAADISLKVIGISGLYVLSPQLFYAYYRQIIPGLPSQWVIQWPDPAHVMRGLTFAADARLAEHVAGALFWGLILQALWCQLETRRRRFAATLGVIASIWGIGIAA